MMCYQAKQQTHVGNLASLFCTLDPVSKLTRTDVL